MQEIIRSLCNSTVTIYRWKDGKVQRQVEKECYFQWHTIQQQGPTGLHRDRKFLLVLPGEPVRVFPGDRVLRGIGPKAENVDWARFVPSAVPGLVEVAYTQPWYWKEKLCHVEAGRK